MIAALRKQQNSFDPVDDYDAINAIDKGIEKLESYQSRIDYRAVPAYTFAMRKFLY